ncbi:MAG: phage virion morphogenesis protein [Azoarcus sp.]|jgi:phage virion morphogenesis protein|nr:phage virion morphogenesis protein [Azoarcus sp.]
MMSVEIEGLEKVERTLQGLMAALSPAARRKLGLRIGQAARRANTIRIGRNVAPDGTPFERRKPQPGRLRRKRGKMFRKLRTIRHLRLARTPDEITLSFEGADAKIARVHHFGLRDRVSEKNKTMVKYPARPLLGLSREDLQAIEAVVLAHLADGMR